MTFVVVSALFIVVSCIVIALMRIHEMRPPPLKLFDQPLPSVGHQVLRQKPYFRTRGDDTPPDDDGGPGDGGPEEPPANAFAAVGIVGGPSVPREYQPPDPGWLIALKWRAQQSATADWDGPILLWRLRRGAVAVEARAFVHPLASQLEVFVNGVVAWTERFKEGQLGQLAETARRARDAFDLQGYIDERAPSDSHPS